MLLKRVHQFIPIIHCRFRRQFLKRMQRLKKLLRIVVLFEMSKQSVVSETLDEIEIPEELKLLDGELFALVNKVLGENRNILLGTNSILKQLKEAKCWFMDGTFEIASSIMRQLYYIHGLNQQQIIIINQSFNQTSKMCLY